MSISCMLRCYVSYVKGATCYVKLLHNVKEWMNILPYVRFYVKKMRTCECSLIVGIKLNISSVICHWNHIAHAKLKVYFRKNALKIINEEIERGKYKFNLDNFNQANLIHNFLTNYKIVRLILTLTNVVWHRAVPLVSLVWHWAVPSSPESSIQDLPSDSRFLKDFKRFSFKHVSTLPHIFQICMAHTDTFNWLFKWIGSLLLTPLGEEIWA